MPGHEKEMGTLRDLYWLHYLPPAGPMATLWDEWLSAPTLWPATLAGGRAEQLRQSWAHTLSSRIMDAEGYVATHQHASIAHQQGWPFPFWGQGGEGTWGWHFSLQGVPAGWHATKEKTQAGWELTGGADRGISGHAWNVELTAPGACVQAPPLLVLPDQAPFMQLRWRAKGLDNAQPYIEWATQDDPRFTPERRFYFEPTGGDAFTSTMVPLYRSPAWKGRITRLRINFDNAAAGPSVGIQALFTQYDSRHNINQMNFARGCCQYFWWTRDLGFLRSNLHRMRLALRYAMENLGGRREKCIVTPWVGHDGRSGLEIGADGKKKIHPGRGIGNNYWDLLPMGRKDAYATIHYYDALLDLAALEQELLKHPEWNLPAGPLHFDPRDLRNHAAEVKAYAGKLFWNPGTGRFVSGIDDDGKSHDYGFTFLNLEAIHYGFATAEQAASIMKWIAGDRMVEGDTSQGPDIYHWWFAPRATTRRNVDYYGWFWSGPETIPWGAQVQDGGAVLGFSYHDLMSRLAVRGPDDTWKRLREIITWFGEVQAAGGYRAYYMDPARGTLQGGGTPGGLGMDTEFFESILVPQIVFDGFLGFRPRGDGFELNPRLPREWPELLITSIQFQRVVLDITARGGEVEMAVRQGASPWPLAVYLPAGQWRVQTEAPATQPAASRTHRVQPGEGIAVELRAGTRIKLTQSAE